VLSRVAESMYWMSRYIERAEDITRMLSVNFDAMLESGLEDEQLGWLALIVASADVDMFHSCYDQVNATNVTEFLLWHPSNANAVLACINRARENARSIREQISSEMWAHINRLYFLGREMDRAEVLRGPHQFFAQIRDGSQAFQGITMATLTHGEPYEFIQLGKYIERASETVRTLDMKYGVVNLLREGSPEANIQLVAMLKSCSAFEPFRRSYAEQLQAWRVAEYLLLSREFPRAVSFCLDHCLICINAISGTSTSGTRPPMSAQLTAPQRAFGRICAELEYLDIQSVLGTHFHEYLHQLLQRIDHAGEEVSRTFFNTQVILPEATDQPPQQPQQQQQQ
jgi:uncharacterized alpha-E superfamily protein